MFGLFKKKDEAPAAPVWPFKEAALSEQAVRTAADMGVRRLRLEANPLRPEFPPAISNAVQTPEQNQALKRVWREACEAAVAQRANRK